MPAPRIIKRNKQTESQNQGVCPKKVKEGNVEGQPGM